MKPNRQIIILLLLVICIKVSTKWLGVTFSQGPRDVYVPEQFNL